MIIDKVYGGRIIVGRIACFICFGKKYVITNPEHFNRKRHANGDNKFANDFFRFKYPFPVTTKARYDYVIKWFQQHMPEAETELIYDTPYQLLVAVVLSAQCTDKRVNMTTPALFLRFPDPASLAAAPVEEILQYIKSISYPNNKARHLKGLGIMLMERFGGEVPLTVEELIQLPGVGRKTANVITSVVDNQPNMAVDTHVFRVSARIGLTKKGSTVLSTEMQLIRYLPKALVYIAHHWLILHGRYICMARQPRCQVCGLTPVCEWYRKNGPVAGSVVPLESIQ